jgi:uncharacterized membrane protein
MEYVLILVFFATIFLTIIYPPEKVLCSWGVFFLMFFSQSINVDFPYFPPIKIFHLVLMPLFVIALIKRGSRWKFSFVDLLVVTSVFSAAISQYYSVDRINITSVFGSSFLNIIMAYVVFKLLLAEAGYLILFLRRIVYSAVIIAVLGIYEWRMSTNIFVKVAHLISENFKSGKVIGRFGWWRVTGPYGHPIHASAMASMFLMFHHLLSKCKLINSKFKWLSFLPINKIYLFYFLLFLGVLLPLSRGPVFSLALSICFVYLISGKIISPGGLIKIFIGIALLTSGYIYYQSSSGEEKNVEFIGQLESSSQARKTAIDKMLPAIYENPILGVGSIENRNEKVVKIIDNHYLYLAYQGGLLGLISFSLVMIIQFVRLIIRGKKLQKKYRVDSVFSYTFSGVIFLLAVIIVNVVLLHSLNVLYYCIIGMFEAHLCNKQGYLDLFLEKNSKSSARKLNNPGLAVGVTPYKVQ